MATYHRIPRRLATYIGLALLALSLAWPLCADEPTAAVRVIEAARPDAAQEFFKGRKKQVLTFLGYSGAGYEDPKTMLEAARAALKRHDPAKTIVNIGATEEGIGAVYELARSLGFETAGVVSSRAQKSSSKISPHVQSVIFVRDESWGGLVPDTDRLSPTSQAVVAVSDELVAIGGGPVARDELEAALKASKKVEFVAADMQHVAAIDKAKRLGQPAPTDFRGAADAWYQSRKK